MPLPHIETHNAWVEFPIFDAKTRSLKKAFLGKAGGAIGRNESNVVVIEALRDITMSLELGDRVGLVGHNGAGKSTLLRLLSGIYEPTRGVATVTGRVAPVFDLGVGMDYQRFALTVARNVAFDWLRHRQVVPIELVADLEALEVLDEGEQIEEIVNSHQELAMLVKAIQGLPDRCRQVFTLRKVYGYSQKEIALRLSISENTVEQHLTKAARRCAQALFDQPVSERRSMLFDRFRKRKRANVQSE